MKEKFYLITLVIVCCLYFNNSWAQSYTIDTYVGNGTGAYSGDGGVGGSAKLNWPSSVAVDDSNNLYIADLNNNVIRKVNLTTNIITTVAGNYAKGSGYSGDGSAATAAQLNYPLIVAVDKPGNLYIVDQGNKVVRMVNKAGIISTIAGGGTSGLGDGGPATDAELVNPDGVAVDDSGNVYISDYSHERIRKVNKLSGIISTVAGNGVNGYSGDGGPATAAKLWGPQGIAIDKWGNLYISDYVNNVVRKVTNDTITTFAGTGVTGFSGDDSACINAEFHNAVATAFDADSNIYLCDVGNLRIRKINTKGIVTTIAGDGNVGYTGDKGPALSATFQSPQSIAFDAAGNGYIADLNNNVVRKISKTVVTAVKDINADAHTVTVFPNPNKGSFTLQLQNASANTQVQIFNVLGESIYSAKLTLSNNPISLENAAPGIYLYRVTAPGGQTIAAGKFVVE